MEKFIKNFKHYSGVHCETTALRDIFTYNGIRLSEPMLFGLGEGLGFIYWKSKQMKFPFVGGRDKELSDNLCKNLNIRKQDHFSSSFSKAWNEIKKLIDNDIPVLLKLDMFYLEYFKNPQHFGGHTVVLAGYDNESVYLADSVFESMQKVSLKNFELARTSKSKPFQPKNYYATFEFPKSLPDLKNVIKKSIKENAENMLNPPIKNLGVEGIKKFGEEIIKFSKYDTSIYKYLYIWLEKAGNGGSCFRNLYKDFLKEFLEYVNNKNLQTGYEKYQNIAKAWRDISDLLLEIGKGETERLKDIQEKIFEVYMLEKYALQILKRV